MISPMDDSAERLKHFGRNRRTDLALILPLTFLYAVFAFLNLGSSLVPESGYIPTAGGESWIVDLGEAKYVDRLWIYSAIGDGEYRVDTSVDGERWSAPESAVRIKRIGPYFWNWSFADLGREARFLKWTVETPGENLLEILATRIDGDPAQRHYVAFPAASIVAGDGFSGKTEDLISLVDEQYKFAEGPGYWTGMHFDEIYHARTAWEHIHHIEPYEYTHPPLGKIMIGWGIRIFGMNPWGWRFVGTLFGVLMLPLIYAFARSLFRRPEPAFFAAAFFAVDFMHFAQTRISTIDTYVVFWIIAMYAAFWPWLRRQFGLAGWTAGVSDTLARARDTWTKKAALPADEPAQQASGTPDKKHNQTLEGTNELPGPGPERRRALWMFTLSGLCFGFGAASKWTALYAALGLGIGFLAGIAAAIRALAVRSKIAGAVAARSGKARRAARAMAKNVPDVRMWLGEIGIPILVGLVAFIAVPAVIYYLSYIPYFQVPGHTGGIAEVIEVQKRMYSYHSELVATHSFGSKWYEWPVMIRPIWYYTGADFVPVGVKSTIASFGNPVIWWGGLVAILATCYFAVRRKDALAGFIVLGYCAQFLPWAIAPRDLTFIYHYFPSIPFIVLALVYVLFYAIRRTTKLRFLPYYLLLAGFLLLVMFYPALSGAPTPANYVDGFLRWFPSWYF